MKTVIVRPERCVSCHQCSFQCAVAHSESKTPIGAISESILSKPRIRIYQSSSKENFPNKCRHCEPAPCEMACITKAIYRETKSGVVLIKQDRCINCGMCAMACPFSVVRYYPYIINRQAAHKCDQCIDRQKEGKIPSCVKPVKWVLYCSMKLTRRWMRIPRNSLPLSIWESGNGFMSPIRSPLWWLINRSSTK